MHATDNGREPLRGLTFERPTPVVELARGQGRILQTWACGFDDSAGALLFGKVWADPNNPKWEKDLKFPLGTCVFKVCSLDCWVSG